MAWFRCIGGGGSEPTSVPVSMKVKTTSTDGYTASVELTTYEDVKNVVYSTVMGESNAVVFGAVSLYYDTAWYLKAFTTCEYNGNTYNKGDLIDTWSYAVNVNMRIDYTVPRGNATVKQGTFVSATSQYGIVDGDCGFKPDMIMVKLPFGNNDTTSYWEKSMSWAETKAMWNLYPAELVAYVVDLGRVDGETGIQAINNNGFSFMSNGGNTQGVTCEYIAVKYEAKTIVDYTTNYFPCLLDSNYYTVFSKAANDEIYCSGRGGTRASGDQVFYFCCWGYGIIGLTSASVQVTATTNYGSAEYYTQTTTNGRTVYLARLASMIGGPSDLDFRHSYLRIAIGSSQSIEQSGSTDLFDQTFVDAAYEALIALS